MTIVTTHYRYRRPPKKRKAVALEVTTAPERVDTAAAPDKPSVIVSTISRKEARFRRQARALSPDPDSDTDEALTARYQALIAAKLKRP